MTPPAISSDLADLLQLLAALIAKGESVRDVLDYCRGRVETAPVAGRTLLAPERPTPAVNAPAKTSDLMTTKEACALLRCARSTLYAMFHRQEVKKAKVGGATRWRKSQLERYIEMQTRGAQHHLKGRRT
jgi:excisionase family DNA binding protein